MKTLCHFTKAENAEKIQTVGLTAASAYEIFTPLRENVVFCWLSQNDNKTPRNGEVCFQVTVDENRCIVADMEWISFAMMYKYGRNYGLSYNPRKNEEVSELFVKIYEQTSVPLKEYRPGIFFSPEVLVKGDITADCVKIC